MPLMYHKDAKEPVNVSDGSIDTMLNRDWFLKDEVETSKDEQPVIDEAVTEKDAEQAE